MAEQKIVDYSDSEGESDSESAVIVLSSDSEGECDSEPAKLAHLHQAKLDSQWEQVRIRTQHDFDVEWELLTSKHRGRKVVITGVSIRYILL